MGAIVEWETGRFLATLCRALDPVVLEVGTAIGYSGLHMAEQLSRGRVISLELDPDRVAQARASFERAGVADRIEIVEGDAHETLTSGDVWLGSVLPIGDGVGFATRR